ncbi:uncharacterized protein LOC115237773 [Formica exsecta]|uniref:uncharacterized protein LOC115237773 n=1 Tax=Formica exsecta TaxID=72781 RepID=UPI00114457A4|nr:uncharacterized protein LOC115237773 [Formica exsecta]
MSRQCDDPKCIALKEKFTTHKYKNKEKDPRPSSTSYQNSLDNSIAPQNKRQKRTKSEPKHSKDSSKKMPCLAIDFWKLDFDIFTTKVTRISLICTCSIRSTEPNAFERISGSSQNYMKQICTCRKNEHHDSRSGSLHGHANSQNVSTERSKRKRKRSHRRHKKASRRESDRLRHDCFTRLCVCVRGRSSDELRACKCTSHEITSSDHECCCVKVNLQNMSCHVAANRRLFQARRKKRVNRLISKSILRNDIPTDRHTAEPSASDKKPRFKYPDELLQEKSNEERNVIIKGLDTICKGINRFGARIIRLFKSEN